MIFFSYKSSLIFRESWGSHLKCIFFLLGHSHNQSVNELAKTEVEWNDDIIQIQMIDEYHHLTQKVERTEILTVKICLLIKGLSLLNLLGPWMSSPVFLYGDDDIVINTDYLNDVSSSYRLKYVTIMLIILDIQSPITVIFVPAAFNYR